jgi:cyclic pyranopterin phosphate synthase
VPLLDVILGYDCNLFCDYCTITLPMRERALETGAVVRAMRDARARGTLAISFTGGEPTIRADLLGLVRAASSLGFSDIKIQTNGLLLGQGRNLERLVAAGANRFHLSIHTHRRDRYDALVRREGTYDLMVAGLRALVARGLRTTADVILKEDTYRDLPDALAWLHGLGLRSVHLWFVSLTDGNADNRASLPRMSDVAPVMARAFAWARAHEMDVRSLHVPRCLLGSDHPHAWDPGAEGVTVVSPDATFDLSASRLAGHEHVPACEGCEHRPTCPGLRTDYLARFGDAEIAAARRRPASVPRHSLPIV